MATHSAGGLYRLDEAGCVTTSSILPSINQRCTSPGRTKKYPNSCKCTRHPNRNAEAKGVTATLVFYPLRIQSSRSRGKQSRSRLCAPIATRTKQNKVEAKVHIRSAFRNWRRRVNLGLGIYRILQTQGAYIR